MSTVRTPKKSTAEVTGNFTQTVQNWKKCMIVVGTTAKNYTRQRGTEEETNLQTN